MLFGRPPANDQDFFCILDNLTQFINMCGWALKRLLIYYWNCQRRINWYPIISHEGKMLIVENVVGTKLEFRGFINNVMRDFVGVLKPNVWQSE